MGVKINEVEIPSNPRFLNSFLSLILAVRENTDKSVVELPTKSHFSLFHTLLYVFGDLGNLSLMLEEVKLVYLCLHPSKYPTNRSSYLCINHRHNSILPYGLSMEMHRSSINRNLIHS
jgi:hypothetical protein